MLRFESYQKHTFFQGLQTPDTDIHLKMVSEMFPGGVVIDINRAQKFIIQGKVKEAIPLLKVDDRGWNNFVKGSKNTLIMPILNL